MKIIISADGRKLCASTGGQPLTSGSVGIEAAFVLSADYDGLAVTAVFRAGDVSVDVLLTGPSCTVPWEVLETSGHVLIVGVVGKNGSGEIVIPTIWGRVGMVECGTVAEGIDPQDPTPDIAAQLLQIAQENVARAETAETTATEAATAAGESATAAGEAKTDAESAAQDAEAWAVGKRGGTDVGSTDPAYHNNAKYYAEEVEEAAPFYAVYGQSTKSEIYAALNDKRQVYVKYNGMVIPFAGRYNYGGYPPSVGYRFALTINALQYVCTLENTWRYVVYDLGEPARRAEDAAAAALNHMNSADQSAQSAAHSASDASRDAGTASGAATTATTKAGEASDSATAADGSAKDAEAYAVGKRGGTDVGSSDPAYHNNSKYYAEQASGSAIAAGNAQTAAETAQGKAEDAQEAAEQAQSGAEAAAQSVSQSAAQISQNASDISDLKSALNGIENTEGIIRWGTVGGGVLAPNPSSTGVSSVGIAREDNILTLSGTSAIANVRINITFALHRSSTAADLRNSIQTFLPFIKGHKYALRFNYISGSDTDNKPVYIIIRTAEHQDVNSVSFEDGEIYKEITWDYDGNGYVFLYVPNASGVTFNDYRFSFTIIDLTVSQKPLYDYIDNKNSFTGNFPPSYVIVDKTTNVDGTLSADNGNCTSRVISFVDYVKVIAPDGINVSAVDCTNHINLTGNPLIIPPNVDVAFNFNKSNGVFSRADFDSITFKSSQSCWNIFNNDFIQHVSVSSRIEAWNTSPANYERSFAYNKFETGDRWGFIINTGITDNSISKLLIADVDLLLVSKAEMTLSINNTMIIVPQATFYKIEKGTSFIVSSEMRMRNTLIISDNNSYIYNEIGNQNIGSSFGIRCDSAFLLDTDKLVMIAKETGAFNVIKNNEIIQTGAIGSSVGHANSCNYIPESGMLYVSTWDDGKTIACYKVTDGETVSFEFIKNIIIDNADVGACEYYVADKDEKVIIGLGWKYTYNKSTNESQNALEVSVYTKINGVYEITKRFLVFAPGELQGMTFNKKDNCIYYLAGAVSGYNHTGINSISLDGYSYVALPGEGSILNIETESIIQLTNSNNYLVVANNGARFVCGIAD